MNRRGLSIVISFVIVVLTSMAAYGVTIDGQNHLSITVASNEAPILDINKTGFREIYLSWTKVSNADGYELYRYDSKSSTFVLITSISGGDISEYVDQSVTEKNTYNYKIRPYFVDDTDSTKTYGVESNVKFADTSELWTSLTTDTKVKFSWTQSTGAAGYEVEKYNSSTGKYVSIATLGDNIFSYSDVNLSASKTYLYRVKPYYIINERKTYGSASSPLKVVTPNATIGYFNEKVKWAGVWPGVYITGAKASNTTMDNYTLNGKKPIVKYNYSSSENKLYIHVYLKISGSGANKKFEFYKWSNRKYVKTGTSSHTYKQLFLSGIQSYWEGTVVGDSYDFKPGVKFNTDVVIHETGTSGQKYIDVRMGNTTSDAKFSGGYWYYVKNASVGRYDGQNFLSNYNYDSRKYDVIMYLSTQYLTAIYNKGTPYYTVEASEEAWKSVAAHELGHCLGIDDGYSSSGLVRMTKSTETGIYSKNTFFALMYGSRKIHAVDNDIEMALQAQGEAMRNVDASFESYKTYTSGGWYHKRSDVIRK